VVEELKKSQVWESATAVSAESIATAVSAESIATTVPTTANPVEERKAAMARIIEPIATAEELEAATAESIERAKLNAASKVYWSVHDRLVAADAEAAAQEEARATQLAARLQARSLARQKAAAAREELATSRSCAASHRPADRKGGGSSAAADRESGSSGPLECDFKECEGSGSGASEREERDGGDGGGASEEREEREGGASEEEEREERKGGEGGASERSGGASASEEREGGASASEEREGGASESNGGASEERGGASDAEGGGTRSSGAASHGAAASAGQRSTYVLARPFCSGVYARHLFGDAGDNSLYLHENAMSPAYSVSNASVTLIRCKSCPLNCTNCKQPKPLNPCPFRWCALDGVKSHTHRGTFRPEGAILCSGEGYQGTDQCRRCQWLEASTGRVELWKLLKLDGTPLKSPLHQTAAILENKRAAGTLRMAPAPQKRDDLMTINDYRTRLAKETAQRAEMDRQRDNQVSEARKNARFATRHQATAEQVCAHMTAERDRAHANTRKAQKNAAAATVAAAITGAAATVAVFETEAARKSEAAAKAAAEAAAKAAALATEQQEAATAVSTLLSSQLEVVTAAEAAARAQRDCSRAEREASELQLAHAQMAAARELAATAQRLSNSELHACRLQAELTSTLSKVRASP
jgi:hypothetical protein